MLRPVIKKTANHDAWQNSNTAGFQSKPKPAAISGGRSVRSGKGERWATMIGEVVQCYSRERYENPQPILPGMLIERGCPKSRHRPGSSADVLIFQRGPISFDEDLIVNRDR